MQHNHYAHYQVIQTPRNEPLKEGKGGGLFFNVRAIIPPMSNAERKPDHVTME
jgi:hypothetical protein